MTVIKLAKKILDPMLAKNFKEMKDIDYPVYVQPKFDGLRCIATMDAHGDVILQSREGNKFTVPHIEETLADLFNKHRETILDGELYVHGGQFNQTVSLVKKPREESKVVEYHVYDVPRIWGGALDSRWQERRDRMGVLSKGKHPGLFFHPGVIARDDAELMEEHEKNVGDGYEGTIIRTLDGLYEVGKRSKALLKLKDFEDAEFKVIDVNPGVGKMAGCAIFKCITKEKTEFTCVMTTTYEERAAQLKNRKKYIGKMLTVQFFGKSEKGNPRFPVAKGFRPNEDFKKVKAR